jgi:hypothetical protein
MLNVNDYEAHVVARLLDFFSFKAPWQRGLWSSGIVLSLRETLEASQAVAAGALSNASLHNVATFTMVLAGKDPGVGDEKQKRALQEALRVDIKKGGLRFLGIEYRILALLAKEIDSEYLKRWNSALATANGSPGAERTARAIAAHMLDAGFSEEYLHRWWTYKTKHEPGAKSLPEIVAEAHDLITKPFTDFEMLVAFEHAPIPGMPIPEGWLSNSDVSQWLRLHGFDVSGVRQRGGLRIQRAARDPRSAAEAAIELVERITSRSKLGSYKPIVPLNNVWVAGEPQPFRLHMRRRRVEVHALHRENQIYNTGKFTVVDAAMELVAPLDSESPSPAIAGAWAGIEALLTGPGDEDRVSAADRMASLVACSFPRAELTALSYELEKEGGVVADQLRACTTNRDRGSLLAGLITAGTPPTFASPSDSAALARITVLLTDPATTLKDIEVHASNCFRRLYRHRNLVLHWGRTDAVGLRACLRTVAPLVGAGLDRIAHGWFVEHCEPLELAARARIKLDTVGSATGSSALDLLE